MSSFQTLGQPFRPSASIRSALVRRTGRNRDPLSRGRVYWRRSNSFEIRSNMSFELAKIMRRNGRSDSLPSSANIALDHAENSVNPHAMW